MARTPQKRGTKGATAHKSPAAPPVAAPVSKLPALPARRAAAVNPWTVSNHPQLIVAAAAAVLIVATLALARDPSRKPSVTLNAASANPEPLVQFETVNARPAALPTAAPVKAGPSREPRLATATPGAPVKMAPIVTTPVAPTSAAGSSVAINETAGDEAPSDEPTVRSYAPSTQAATSLRSVTITGCLEVSNDGDQFRLTDTDGADAPKARGWRSGFLKKRPAPVDLIASDAAALRRLVGRRVSATGLLDSRELHVRSFRSAGSCG